ncbi:MAG: ATP-binding cassette domain-containing protein [Litorivicinus sp.]
MVEASNSNDSIGIDSKTQRHSIGRELWSERGYLRESIIAGIVVNLMALVLPLFVMTSYDRVLPNAAFSSLWALALGVVLAALMDVFARSARSKLLEHLGRRIDLRLGARMLSQMLRVPYINRPKQLGEISAGFREMESLRALLSNTTLTVLVDLPFALLFMGVVAFLSPALAIPGLLALPILVVIALISGRMAASHQPAAMEATRAQSAALIEGFGQYETIKAMALERVIQDRWERATVDRTDHQDESRAWNAVPSHLSAAISMLASAGVVVIGAYLVAEQQTSMGALIAAMILTGRAVAPAAGLAGLMNAWTRARQAFGGVGELLSASHPDGEHQAQVRGEWQLDGVEVAYPDMAKPALSDISLTIKPGERIGVLGRGGSGKTTLARILGGVLVPQRGLVKLDQVDLAQWNSISRAAGIGYLAQQPGFFAGTVRENLLWGIEQPDEVAIQKAAELTGLDRYLANWAAGWEHPVGEGGGMLSGGQRAVLALTRVILHDPAWIVMDEPTAHLDARHELALRERLKPWLAQRGVLLVTHRSTLLSWVDRLMIVENGKLVADGPKQEVLNMLKTQREVQ